MQYIYNLPIPANTLKPSPESHICRLSQGIVSKVSIGFPPGPKGLAHLVICRFESQIWPTNPESDFAWDNHVIEFASEFKLDAWPFTLKLYGWNLDDTFLHTITVGFNILRGSYGLTELLRLRMPQDVGLEG